MIGNDIIDLKVAGIHSRWQEQRFLNKLFTADEQKFILKDSDHFQTIWLLWSMKESAYKIYSRNTKVSIFNPKSFCCEVASETTGIVTFERERFNTTTEYNPDVIYTTAHLQCGIQISENFKLKGGSQVDKAQELRERAIHTFADLTSISEDSISIEKSNFGTPHFSVNQKVPHNVLTLTHHGQYGGFAISY